jgi:hypothetical protein
MATNGYDPSLEFPGVGSEQDVTDETGVSMTIERSPFLLVVIRSPVIPPRRNVAEVSAHNEVSIGRDIPSEPGAARLRLKEMAVSKYHAIIYWDLESEAWGLVDVGSVHGTFVKSYGNSTSIRLSSAKVASHPRYLRHLDTIQIGGTTMVCHLHNMNEASCEECDPSTGNELSLIHAPKVSKLASPSASDTNGAPQDGKQSLAKLKKQLLRHDYKRDKTLDVSPNTYVDRAAFRRMHLGISAPSVAIPIPESSVPRHSQARTYARASQIALDPTEGPSEIEADPLPTSNVGHRLLSMQGWKPGMGLGLDMAGTAEPLIIKPMAKRAGIGSDVAR